jgi:hypothetical protein
MGRLVHRMTKPLRVLSLGAGVQSTAVLLMMVHGEIPKADHVIFSDTGWEPKAVYKHLEKLEVIMAENDIPFHKVSFGNIRQDFIESETKFATMPLYTLNKEGKKSMLMRQCTNDYKIKPLNKIQRELAGLKKGQRSKEHLITTVIGISLDESQRMRTPAFSWMRNEYPLVDMGITRQDCIDWCVNHGYAIPPRSACIGCPFKRNDEWRELKNNPEEWQDAVDFDHALRQKERLKQRFGWAGLHSSMKPLDEVDLRTDQEKGVFGLFDGFNQECEGMCGI